MGDEIFLNPWLTPEIEDTASQKAYDRFRQYAEQTESLKRPQKMLIGSLFGEKILLLTPLALWYVNQGLVITKVYQIVQYTPARCFEKFGHTVTDARRSGDVDKSKSLLADTCKLIGKNFNSTFLSLYFIQPFVAILKPLFSIFFSKLRIWQNNNKQRKASQRVLLYR